MEERARPHAELDAGRPELWVVRRRARLEQPLLTLVEHGERTPERGARRLSQRRQPARRLPRAADVQAGHGVAKLAAEIGRVVHLGLADREAGRRALLAVVGEGRTHEVADGLITVRE